MKRVSKHNYFLLLFALFFAGFGHAQLTSSELPIVIITTSSPTFSDATIPDEPKINANMAIIDNGPGVLNNVTDTPNAYNRNIGIETRGNSTQGFEKKTYSLELRTNLNMDTSVSLLGMGGEEDWILHAMVIDKSQLRIPMTFDFARSMGHYASNYRYVEVVIDGDYRGLYILTEKIKRDDDRVNIAKLKTTDITGDDVTGGYILRIDWLDDPEGFASNYNAQAGNPMFFQYYYPKAINIQPAQTAYISGYMNTFETALFGADPNGHHWSQYADLTSFVDFLIINEISKNSDGYKLSSYVHKNKQSWGGKLKAGPIWDFDQTYGLSTVCSCDDYTGWTYLQNQPACEDLESMPMWWQTMMNDTVFTNHLACRWNTLRNGILHTDSINAWIDSHEAMIANATNRNFQKWDDFIGESIWAEPDPIPQTYAEEISAMKSWIANRMSWLDANMPGNCQFDVASIEEEFQIEVRAFPNPTSSILNVESPVQGDLVMYDLSGNIVLTDKMPAGLKQLNISDLSNGVYILAISANNQVVRKKVVVN